MDFSYPAEVEQFRKELRTWLTANLTDEVRDADRRRGRDPDAFDTLRAWDAAVADAGWGAVSWPQEYGGRGATVLEQLVYAEETTRARAPVPLNVIGMNNIAPAIMQYGTDAQKRAAAPPDGARRRHLVPGHVRAGGRLRPGVAAHPRRARR